MTDILLIRHGQSANNAQPENLRVCDPALTELGVVQANALAKRLEALPLTRIFCSPFLRACETARPVAARKGMRVFVRPDIFEEGGCYSGHAAVGKRGEAGMGYSELKHKYPGWSIDSAIAESGWWGREHETVSQARLRADAVGNWLEQEIVALGGTHVLVIHADFKYLLLQRLFQDALPIESSETLYNTGISQCYWTGTAWEQRQLNAVDHLSGDLITR